MIKAMYNFNNKILNQVQLWKKENKVIVFTNGCFDLLHRGHIELLKVAKSYGDILLVGLNSDLSVKTLKGNKRPIEDEETRAKKLMKLDYVNFVYIFKDKTPIKLIELICPDYLIKGGDYSKSKIIGADFVENNGGEVIILPLIKGYSTTSIIKKKREGLV